MTVFVRRVNREKATPLDQRAVTSRVSLSRSPLYWSELQSPFSKNAEIDRAAACSGAPVMPVAPFPGSLRSLRIFF